MLNDKIDQVTLVGPADISSMKLHILATALNCLFVSRSFYLHPSTPEAAAEVAGIKGTLPPALLENVVFVKEDELLPVDTVANKWIYQQLLKLSCDKLRDLHNLSELFLFTDIDTLCLKATTANDWRIEGKPVFFAQTDNQTPLVANDFSLAPAEHRPEDPAYQDFLTGMNYAVFRLLGLEKAPKLSAIHACVIWSQKIMRKLKRHIEQRYAMAWHEAIIAEYVNFILNFRKNFSHGDGFRKVVFSSAAPQPPERQPSFEKIYRNSRDGFSEWQLYTYFLYMSGAAHPYKIALLGRDKGPLISEFNTWKMSPDELASFLRMGQENDVRCTNFHYFYPGIDGAFHAMLEAHFLAMLANWKGH